MKKIFILLALISSLFVEVKGQVSQVGLQTQYFYNPYIYNPSWAGLSGNTSILLNYKKQWWGIEGAPTQTNLTFELPFFESRLTAASQLTLITEGPFQNLQWLATGAYMLPLDIMEEHRIYFGMSMGIENYQFNMNKISDQTDPAIVNLAGTSRIGVTGNAGIGYSYNSLRVGFALPRLFGQDPVIQNNQGNSTFESRTNTFEPLEYWIASASYKFITPLTELGFQPQVLIHANKYTGNQIEGMFTFYYKELLRAGVAYRQDYGLSAYVGANIKERFSLNYVYGFSNTSSAKLPGRNGTHELGLSVIIQSEQRDKID